MASEAFEFGRLEMLGPTSQKMWTRLGAISVSYFV
jgi:hypothetical protein